MEKQENGEEEMAFVYAFHHVKRLLGCTKEQKSLLIIV